MGGARMQSSRSGSAVVHLIIAGCHRCESSETRSVTAKSTIRHAVRSATNSAAAWASWASRRCPKPGSSGCGS